MNFTYEKYHLHDYVDKKSDEVITHDEAVFDFNHISVELKVNGVIFIHPK